MRPGPEIPTDTSFFLFLRKGVPYPENSAQRMLGVGDFLCRAEAAAGFFCMVYIPLRGERMVKRE
jgi:hypothetical protein